MPPQPERMNAMAARLGVSIDAFLASYHAHRGPYDGGLAPERYWATVVDSLGCRETPELIEALIADDTAAWGAFREEVWSLARDFRARGGQTAFLSNNVPPLMAHLRALRQLDA